MWGGAHDPFERCLDSLSKLRRNVQRGRIGSVGGHVSGSAVAVPAGLRWERDMILAGLIVHVTGGDNGGGVWYLELSGFVGDVLTVVPWFVAFWLVLRHHNCHVDGCRSVWTSTDPAVHAPACRRHHSLGHLHGETQSQGARNAAAGPAMD
jgi:hypothetical protein